MTEYRYVVYADERPKKTAIVWATCIGAALDACKVILGPTNRPCAIATGKREVAPC